MLECLYALDYKGMWGLEYPEDESKIPEEVAVQNRSYVLLTNVLVFVFAQTNTA